jgi:poly(3-hydroxybutyrate) depolymerase
MRLHYMQPDVGHYGVFNGSRFRQEIAPRIIEFTRLHSGTRPSDAAPKPTRSGRKSAPKPE